MVIKQQRSIQEVLDLIDIPVRVRKYHPQNGIPADTQLPEFIRNDAQVLQACIFMVISLWVMAASP